MSFELDSQELVKKGFVLNNHSGLIVDFSKKIDERTKLVFAISPLQECFVWVLNDDFEDEDMDGIKVHILPDSVDDAILIAKKISFVE
ncbi:hypothetical protein [Chryseobacterium sp.]|uniref:hypothetical protein n=1 Tax=Chryseobacterium sp. TaxID=1871047 RepID=UPI0028A03B87|nr:hypothetical protein [Chryseobacterium sp.]